MTLKIGLMRKTLSKSHMVNYFTMLLTEEDEGDLRSVPQDDFLEFSNRDWKVHPNLSQK